MSFVGGGGFLLRAVLVISWKMKNKHYVLVFVKPAHSASFVVSSAPAARRPRACWSSHQEAQRSTELHQASSQLCPSGPNAAQVGWQRPLAVPLLQAVEMAGATFTQSWCEAALTAG